MPIVLLILSIAPVILFGYLIYRRDFDKEPTGILVKLFICGIGSTFLTLFITGLLVGLVPFFGEDTANLSLLELIPYIFIGVALIEEFSKWIFVYKLEYNDNEFNHLYDGIVYAAFVSLGFACLENVLYVMQSGVSTAIARAFLAIPGHLCDGIMMGYYLSLAKLALVNRNPSLSRKNICLSLLVPMLAHGLYDYLLFASDITGNEIFVVIFLAFVAFFFSYAARKVKQLSTNYFNLNPYYITQRQRQSYQNSQYNQYNPYYNQNYMGYNNPYYGGQYQNNGYPYYQQPVNQNYGGQAIATTKYCPNCGQEVSGNFCTNCGHQV